MNDATRLTDDQIAEMLRARVAQPMPPDVPQAVLAHVQANRERGRSVSRRFPVRRRLLLVAAVLVLGGSLAVATVGRPRQQTAPPTATGPAVISDAMTPSPVPSTRARPTSCRPLDLAARNGGEGTGIDPVPGPPSGPAANGNLIILVSKPDAANPSVIDPLSDDPTPVAVSHWDLGALDVNSWNPSPDGTVVAAELGEGDCPNDIFVMRSDGTGLRRPFAAADRTAFTPVWSPGGTRLALVEAPFNPMRQRPLTKPSTVVVWDPKSGATVDLGRPCATCSPAGLDSQEGGLAWSSDSSRLAVDYTDLDCRDSAPATSALVGCRGLAVVSADGAWETIPISGLADRTNLRLLAWSEAASVIVVSDGLLVRIDVHTGAITPAGTTNQYRPWRADQLFSPDRTKVITDSGDQRYLEIRGVETGASTRFEGIPPDWLDIAWSPDSRWLLVQAWAGGEADRGLYLVRVDGSQRVRHILPGGFGRMAWLPAAGSTIVEPSPAAASAKATSARPARVLDQTLEQ